MQSNRATGPTVKAGGPLLCRSGASWRTIHDDPARARKRDPLSARGPDHDRLHDGIADGLLCRPLDQEARRRAAAGVALRDEEILYCHRRDAQGLLEEVPDNPPVRVVI